MIWTFLTGLVIAGLIVLLSLRRLRRARRDSTELMDSLIKNAEENLGVAPDAASLAFLATHPFLSAKIWEMLGAAGASLSGYLPEYQRDCDELIGYVRDESFREECRCAQRSSSTPSIYATVV